MTHLKYLITGCGRSGTQFMSNCINLAGKRCGHEEAIKQNGINKFSKLEYESSWYAVPYLDQLPEHVKILHIVRHPEAVVRSFYKIGIFSALPIQHITLGHYFKFCIGAPFQPRRVLKRIRMVKGHRSYLRQNCSAFDEGSEVRALERYWIEWNQKILEFSQRRNNPYLRIRLEDVASNKTEWQDYLDIDDADFPIN